MYNITAYLHLMRPHQYLKNGFVLLGVIFSHQWQLVTILDAGIVFIAFCAMSSSVYIMNDITDVEYDRQHPVKCSRPLPSERISINHAKLLASSLFLVSTILALTISLGAIICVTAYFLLNILYSRWLKHVVILDVFVISTGFMLRILSGTLALGIQPSEWLLLCGFMVTLFLGFAKRRAELLMLDSTDLESPKIRRVLDDYSPALLEQLTAVTAACTLICYALYTVSTQTIEIHGSQSLIYTLPFVTYGIFRYLFLLHHKAQGNDTAKDLLTDRHLLLTVTAWGISILIILA